MGAGVGTNRRGLTDVVLLDLVDVAVDGRVAEEGHHDLLAARQLHHVGRVTLQGVGRRRRRPPQRPGAARDVEDPQLVRHVGPLGFQLPTKHVDVVLGAHQKERRAVRGFIEETAISSGYVLECSV